MLSRCFFAFSVGVGAFVIVVSQISSFFSYSCVDDDFDLSFHVKRDDFGFLIVNFPWLSGDIHQLPSYGNYISQMIRFDRYCASLLDFHAKTLQITSKLLSLIFIKILCFTCFENRLQKESITKSIQVILFTKEWSGALLISLP